MSIRIGLNVNHEKRKYEIFDLIQRRCSVCVHRFSSHAEFLEFKTKLIDLTRGEPFSPILSLLSFFTSFHKNMSFPFSFVILSFYPVIHSWFLKMSDAFVDEFISQDE